MRYRHDVAGAIIFVICMVLVVPVAVMFGGAIWSALFGWMSVDDAEARAAGTSGGEAEGRAGTE